MKIASSLFIIVLLAMGCQQQEIKSKRYFDMDSLVSAQVVYLSKSKASLKKEATISDKSSSSVNTLDSTDWSHELDVFRQLDLINRPIYSDVYVISDGGKDSKSNLLVRAYEAPANSTVPYLRLFYQTTPARLKRLEALYQETNSLYNSTRKLEMYFDDATGKPCLTGFFVDGHQKMILSDSVYYTIRAEIQLANIP
jgi:hypothetical protein